MTVTMVTAGYITVVVVAPWFLILAGVMLAFVFPIQRVYVGCTVQVAKDITSECMFIQTWFKSCVCVVAAATPGECVAVTYLQPLRPITPRPHIAARVRQIILYGSLV